MAYKVRNNYNDESVLNDIDRQPDTCPACGKGIEPIFCCQHGVDTWREYDGFLQIIFRCPRKDCQRLFVAIYLPQRVYGGTSLFLQKAFLLDYFEVEKFSESISKVSEKFSRIFNQAKIAEENGLDEIAGIGYGKALEFLVKDYLIHKIPEKSDVIKSMFLSDAIKQMGEEEKNIKKCAERANWLRTDETHYEKRWTDHDINDLKNLIRLTVNWIENSLLTEQYEEELQIKKVKSW